MTTAEIIAELNELTVNNAEDHLQKHFLADGLAQAAAEDFYRCQTGAG
jgi:hypothetical protein